MRTNIGLRWYIFMVISVHKTNKPVALLLVAALLLSCSYAGLKALQTCFFPRDYALFVEEYCEKYDIDVNLAYAVIHTESGFDSAAVSPLGACGLMQIMPETIEWLGSKDQEASERFDDVFDPETNIRYGVFFLSLIKESFGNERLLLAAYHAGMGRVSSWLNDVALSSDGKSLHTIPFSDTEHYVKKVERTKRIYETLY